MYGWVLQILRITMCKIVNDLVMSLSFWDFEFVKMSTFAKNIRLLTIFKLIRDSYNIWLNAFKGTLRRSIKFTLEILKFKFRVVRIEIMVDLEILFTILKIWLYWLFPHCFFYFLVDFRKYIEFIICAYFLHTTEGIWSQISLIIYCYFLHDHGI